MLWYKDKNLEIQFNRMPAVFSRYPYFGMTEEEHKSVERYPFINKKDLRVQLSDFIKNKVYQFYVPDGYCGMDPVSQEYFGG